MSAVAPTPSASTASTGGASSVNGPRNGLKAPSNLLHGSQANFAALLFQADEVPDEATTAPWVTDATQVTTGNTAAGNTAEDKAQGALALPSGDPQAFMHWIGLPSSQAASPTANLPPTSASTSGSLPGLPAAPVLPQSGPTTPPTALTTTEAPTRLQTTVSDVNSTAMQKNELSPTAFISIANSSVHSSDGGKLNTEEGTPFLPSDTPPAATPKVRVNGVRVNGTAIGALASAPTSTLRLAAQHQVGMSTSAIGAATLPQQQGATTAASQDADRSTTARASNGFDFLAEAPRTEGLSTGDVSAGHAGNGAGTHQEPDSGASGHGDSSQTWGIAVPEALHHNGGASASEATTASFQNQMDEIAQQMGQWSAQGTQSASLTLDGEGAMPLDIEVTLDKGKVSIRFGADEEGAREALMSHIEATLKPMLAQHGMSLADVQVTSNAGPDTLTQQMNQSQQGSDSNGQGSQAHASQPRGGTGTRLVPPTASNTAMPSRAPRQPQGAVDLFA